MPRRGENIFKRKDGRWEGRYSIGRNIKGRLVYHSVYGKTYRDVKEKVKKHINDISEKYIIPGETTEEAIMFLPAEAIFAEINAYHPELIQYAYNKKVWITGPTTLISTLSIISMIIKNMERDKYAKVIHEELNKLSIEFTRYKERWDKLSRNVKNVNQSLEELHTTSEKIQKRFASINEVELSKLEHKEKIETL